eukprot:gene3184-6281_t
MTENNPWSNSTPVLSEALYLISNFLKRCTPCHETAKQLDDELVSNALLGKIYSWKGESRNATVDDLERKYSRLPADQLLILLEKAVKFAQNQDSSNSKSLLHPSIKASISDCRKIENVDIKDNKETTINSALKHAAYTRENRELKNNLLVAEENLLNTTSKIKQIRSLLKDSGYLLADSLRGTVDSSISYLAQRELGFTNLITSTRSNVSNNCLSRKYSDIKEKLTLNYRLLWTISGHLHHPTYCIVFDNTGNYLISGADDYLVKIWDIERGQLVRTCRGHQGYITIIAVSPDNALIASACTKFSIRIWKFDDGLCLKVLQHKDTVNWLKFDNTCCSLASAGDDGYCFIWDLSILLPVDSSNLPLLDILEEERLASRPAPKLRHTRSSNDTYDDGLYLSHDMSADNTRPSSPLPIILPPIPLSIPLPKPLLPIGVEGMETDVVTEGVSVSVSTGRGGPSFSWSASKASRRSATNTTTTTTAAAAITGKLGLPHLRDNDSTGDRDREDGTGNGNGSGNGSGGGGGQTIKVLTLDISVGGGVVLTGCDDGVARLWRYSDLSGVGVVTKSLKRQMEPALEELRGIVPQEEWEAIEAIATHLICRLEGHVSHVTDASFSNCGDRVVTGSMKDGTVRIWTFSKDYSRHEHILLAVHADDVDNNLKQVQEFSRRRRGARFRDSKSLLYNVCWTCDDQRIITLQSVTSTSSSTNPLAYGVDPSQLPTRLKVWDSLTGTLIGSISEVGYHRCQVLSIHPLNPNICLSAGEDGILNVWNIYTAHKIASHSLTAPYNVIGLEGGSPTPVVDASFSPDGLRIAMTDFIGRVTVIGCDNPSKYEHVRKEQYFSTDYAEVVVDHEGYAIDTNTQLPVHLAPIGPLCMLDGTPYDVQPERLRGPSPLSRSLVKHNLEEVRDWSHNHLNDLMTRHMKLFQRNKQKAFQSSSIHTAATRITSSYSTSSVSKTTAATAISRSNIRTVTDLSRDGMRSPGMRSSSSPMDLDPDSEILPDVDNDSGDDYEGSSWGEGSPEYATGNGTGRRESRRSRLYRDHDGSASTAHSRSNRLTRRGRGSSSHRREGSGHGNGNESHRQSLRAQRAKRAADRAKRLNTKRKKKEQVKKRVRKSKDVIDVQRQRQQHEQEHEQEHDIHSQHVSQSPSIQTVKPWSRIQGLRTVPLEADVDRSWLMADSPQDQRYVPQVGDRVFYFAQGHLEYLRSFPENNPPPWLSFARKWPVVECEVLTVSYDFPTFLEYKRSPSALVYLGLQIVSTPSRWGQGGHGHPILADFITTRQTRGANASSFDITIRRCGDPDFIVPVHLYLRCIKTKWRVGRVVRISDSDHASWPQSPWDCLEVIWDDQSRGDMVTSSSSTTAGNTEMLIPEHTDRVNPWEACPVFLSESAQPAILAVIKPPSMCVEVGERVRTALQALMQEDILQPFTNPVDQEYFPDYYCFVVLPICLTLIEKRIENGYYRTIAALSNDVDLIGFNCSTYNVESSPIVTHAKNLVCRLQAVIRGEDDENIPPIMDDINTDRNEEPAADEDHRDGDGDVSFEIMDVDRCDGGGCDGMEKHKHKHGESHLDFSTLDGGDSDSGNNNNNAVATTTGSSLVLKINLRNKNKQNSNINQITTTTTTMDVTKTMGLRNKLKQEDDNTHGHERREGIKLSHDSHNNKQNKLFIPTATTTVKPEVEDEDEDSSDQAFRDYNKTTKKLEHDNELSLSRPKRTRFGRISLINKAFHDEYESNERTTTATTTVPSKRSRRSISSVCENETKGMQQVEAVVVDDNMSLRRSDRRPPRSVRYDEDFITGNEDRKPNLNHRNQALTNTTMAMAMAVATDSVGKREKLKKNTVKNNDDSSDDSSSGGGGGSSSEEEEEERSQNHIPKKEPVENDDDEEEESESEGDSGIVEGSEFAQGNPTGHRRDGGGDNGGDVEVEPRPRPSRHSSKDIHVELWSIFNKAEALDRKDIFAEPVPEDTLGYYDIVTVPMDLMTIRKFGILQRSFAS